MDPYRTYAPISYDSTKIHEWLIERVSWCAKNIPDEYWNVDNGIVPNIVIYKSKYYAWYELKFDDIRGRVVFN
jgi:hypothetical protein